MHCYIILYSNEGYFLIFEKRTEGYFFQGTIFPPNGTPIHNGPGLFAFPGGALNPGEEPYLGCLREFIEECGNDIDFGFEIGQPQSLATLIDVRINNLTFDILSTELATAGANYHVVCLEFTTESLREIQAVILQTNFDHANQVRNDIHYNEIRNYAEIFQGYPFCPLDDELGDVQLWHIEREINEIRLLEQNAATDWYFDMIVYLANTVLNAQINY